MLWHDAGARVKSESSPRWPSDTACESYPNAVPPTLPVRPSTLEFDSKKDMKHYFREVRNICVEGRIERTRWSHIPVTFSEEDVRLQGFPHNDALVIEANIANWTLGKLLVDNSSSADIIFTDAYDKMGLNQSFAAS
jgi:hypothetical protein